MSAFNSATLEASTSTTRWLPSGTSRIWPAGHTRWAPGDRVRFYRARGGAHVWLPDEDDGEERRDYDVEHYLAVLVGSYASRLRKAFAPEDFERIFRLDGQFGLFDRPIAAIAPLWIRPPARGATPP